MTAADTENGMPSEGLEGIELDAREVRVLGVLAEKEALTPDNYPLSLNALVGGCNQLSSRDPVMTLSEEEVRDTLDGLIEKKLVAEVSQAGARVTKYEHRMRIKWTLAQDKLSVLTILMLRGPQTAGEIRGRSGRMHEFASIADVEAGLQFLIDKYPPLVERLPREPGTKEARYAHTFHGSHVGEGDAGNSDASSSSSSLSQKERIEKLEAEVASLRSELSQLAQELAEFRKQFQ